MFLYLYNTFLYHFENDPVLPQMPFMAWIIDLIITSGRRSGDSSRSSSTETPIVFLFTINLSIMLFLDWTSNIISLLKSRNWGGNKACRSERYTERKSMTDWLTHKQNLCYCIFLSTSVNLYPYLSILVFVIVNQILYSSLDPLECHYLGLQSIFIFRDGTI